MKKVSSKKFNTGDLVFARVRGFPAWPARISGPANSKGTAFHVFFYGTYETAVCKNEEMWHYDEKSKAKFGRQRRKMFPEAMDEIENRPEIAVAESEVVTDNAEIDAARGGETSQTATLTEASTLEEDEDYDDDEDERSLVIDEDAKLKKASSKSLKRKAEDSPTEGSQPPLKQLRVSLTQLHATPQIAETPMSPSGTPLGDEKISRSGRVIKPKKFVDESPEMSPVQRTEDLTTDVKKSTLRLKTPTQVQSKSGEEKETQTDVKNESSGEKIENKLDEEKIVAAKKERVRWLCIEQKLVELDRKIRTYLSTENPNMESVLEFMTEMDSLWIAPLMMKKQPEVVETFGLLKNYVGPEKGSSDEDKDDSTRLNAEKIRTAAKNFYSKLQGLFQTPQSKDFPEFFGSEVKKFNDAVKGLHHDKVSRLVIDPTTAGI